MSFFVDPNSVHQNFYAALSTTIPILGCLIALATDESSALSFYVSSVGTAIIASVVASNELASYRLSFGQRGVLLPTHLRKPTEQ